MNLVLPDLLAHNLSAVFCGTAAGTASARRGAYYAGPGNAFWPTLFEVGLTPHRFMPEQYPELLNLGLGLTDVAKRISGSDDVLANAHFDRDGLTGKILRCKPRIIAFTSKRAAQEYLGQKVSYGLLEERVEQTRLFVLTSPSGAARRYWSIEPWRELALLVNRLS